MIVIWTTQAITNIATIRITHDGVIKWKHYPRYWPFVRGIHRSPVNSSHKGLWRGALMFSLICTRINDWVNNREAGGLGRNRAHYDVIVMANKITTGWQLVAFEHTLSYAIALFQGISRVKTFKYMEYAARKEIFLYFDEKYTRACHWQWFKHW